MANLDFLHPLWFWALPLAALPLVFRTAGDVRIPTVRWLPPDRLGRRIEGLFRALAVCAILAVIIGLAGPGRAEYVVERLSRGAELSILLDRSSSMDATIRRNAPTPGQGTQATQSKNDVVREALGQLLERRPDNRYALTLFNAAAIRVTPFTEDTELVQAGLDASDIGRGPSDTNMGLALLAALDAFDGRRYTGSRAIILVSDGGARLEENVRREIAAGLTRHRVALYFVYIQSSPNSPNLETVGLDVEATVEEIALHQFFSALDSTYRVYQAEDPDSLAEAIRKIDRQQALPLTVAEPIARFDLTRHTYLAALLFCAGIAILASRRRESLR